MTAIEQAWIVAGNPAAYTESQQTLAWLILKSNSGKPANQIKQNISMGNSSDMVSNSRLKALIDTLTIIDNDQVVPTVLLHIKELDILNQWNPKKDETGVVEVSLYGVTGAGDSLNEAVFNWVSKSVDTLIDLEVGQKTV